ncbi:unnamed protein product [Mytilus coruscus]|uniref:Uncharacterized protein n=1 Tax=Mytilus coruscus TaxID=42192 RepID=A0A6J8CWK9_MYTCO|nr:unnamed protein product [Mytilus coruscus]
MYVSSLQIEEDKSISVIGKENKELKVDGEFESKSKCPMQWKVWGTREKKTYHGTIIRTNNENESTEINTQIKKRLISMCPMERSQFRVWKYSEGLYKCNGLGSERQKEKDFSTTQKQYMKARFDCCVSLCLASVPTEVIKNLRDHLSGSSKHNLSQLVIPHNILQASRYKNEEISQAKIPNR